MNVGSSSVTACVRETAKRSEACLLSDILYTVHERQNQLNVLPGKLGTLEQRARCVQARTRVQCCLCIHKTNDRAFALSLQSLRPLSPPCPSPPPDPETGTFKAPPPMHANFQAKWCRRRPKSLCGPSRCGPRSRQTTSRPCPTATLAAQSRAHPTRRCGDRRRRG